MPHTHTHTHTHTGNPHFTLGARTYTVIFKKNAPPSDTCVQQYFEAFKGRIFLNIRWILLKMFASL
jgi:hypothetical protein